MIAIFITECCIYCVDVTKFKDNFTPHLSMGHVKRKFEILKLKDASESLITEASFYEKLIAFEILEKII